jgi:hypothetical protein
VSGWAMQGEEKLIVVAYHDLCDFPFVDGLTKSYISIDREPQKALLIRLGLEIERIFNGFEEVTRILSPNGTIISLILSLFLICSHVLKLVS